MRLALLLALGACTGQTGTVTLGMTEAPGSTLLAGVQSLKVTLTSPAQEFDVARDSTGFDLAFDVDADGTSGSIIIDGFDAGGTLVATGASPAFPIAAIDATVVIYMAPPRSLLAAPLGLPAATSALATGALTYGAIFSGGLDGTGAPTTGVSIYNAFDHSIGAGLAMPAARAGQVLGVSSAGIVYMFGGTDATQTATGSLWRFDTTVAPSGEFFDLGDHPDLARADQSMILTGADELVVSGSPVFELAALGTTVANRTSPTSLPAAGAGLTTPDGITTAIFADTAQLVRFRADLVDDLPAAVPPDPVAAALPPGDVVVAGSTTTLLLVDAASGAITTAPAIATPRKDAALGATDRYIIVAGGTDPSGAIVGTAEVFDPTLAPIATLPMVVPRTKASAIPLANGQILIVGGVDGSGAPIATIELFTPESH